MPGHLILVRPHASLWDGFVVAWHLRRIGGHRGSLFAVDPDYARHPLYRRVLNWYGWLTGRHTMAPLDQRSPMGMRTLIQTLQGGGCVVLFPQGTGLARPDRPDLPGAAWLICRVRPMVTEMQLDHSGRIPFVVQPNRQAADAPHEPLCAHRLP